MNYLLFPASIVGGLGLVYGLILAIASKKFYVEVDPKIEEISEALPGVNCGACAYPGCSAYAEAIVRNSEDITKCAPGGDDVISHISSIMGVSADLKEKNIAVIKCQSGGANNTFFRYDYNGVNTCLAMGQMADGINKCSYGCMGGNDCVRSCKFNAIELDEFNNRIINKELCTGCGACVACCPRELIELVPISKQVHVKCMSKDAGAIARGSCGAKKACIGCTLCAKVCPTECISIDSFLATINYEKCISCGLCTKKCPTKAIATEKTKVGVAEINPKKCIGCTLCARGCPVDAIDGELKKPHSVRAKDCIGCEVCYVHCPRQAIKMRYGES